MAFAREKIANLLEYFGVRSGSYYHSATPMRYDPDDFLAYYLDQSERTAFGGEHDSDGIPRLSFAGKTDYHPIMICLWTLGHVEHYRLSGNDTCADTIRTAADWLVRTQQSDGSWRMPYDVKTFNLAAGFPSAMLQGLAISCLTRAFQIFDRAGYLDAAVKALDIFDVPVEDGGVLAIDDDRPFYEEYPSTPYQHVFNGFIFSLWGVYDLVRLYEDATARRLWDAGRATLESWLPRFDTGYWTLYHIGAGRSNPATLHYHRLHIEQLKVMDAITGDAVYDKFRQRWEGYLNRRFNALRTLPAKLRWSFLKSR